MKKVMLIGILFCMVMSLTACDLKDATPEAMHQTIDGIVYTLEGCCRRGKLSEMDGQLSLQKLIADNLDDQEIVFIGDLYWCMLSFAMCHEIAHLYCEHGCPRSTDDGYIRGECSEGSKLDS